MSADRYPRWTWADVDGMRVEVAEDTFVDFVRRAGVWRQQTRPMTAAESVEPGLCWLGGWRDGVDRWPVVDAVMAVWLDKTFGEIPSRL